MTTRTINLTLLFASTLILLGSLLIGDVAIPAHELWSALRGGAAPTTNIILWEIRLPRALAAFSVGATLGLCGAALQGLLRNPLAEPGVLGVSGSAAFSGALLLYGVGAGSVITANPVALPLAAISGALVCTALLVAVALRVRGMTSLLLVGVALSSLAGAGMALLLNLAPNPFSLSDLVNWTLGSVANRDMSMLATTLPFMIAGAAILWTQRAALGLLVLGEETAQALGVGLSRVRWITVFGAGIATGGAVALAGIIGFVGIIAPHVARRWTCGNLTEAMLPSAWIGGLLLLLSDIAVRVLPTTNEIHLGVFAALIGAPLFIWIALDQGRNDG